MLDVHNLSYAIKGRPLLQGVHLSLAAGRLYGILGPNGAGKSTLFKTLTGIWPPTTGHVFWQGASLLDQPRLKISQILSWVPQNPFPCFDFTVEDLVRMGCYPHRLSSAQAEQRTHEALRKTSLWELRMRSILELSGGERQRAYIARALATGAPILLLDEPTSHLDLYHQLEIEQLLKSLTQAGQLILMALHDLQAAQRLCDEVVILNRGQCLGQGTYSALVTPSLIETVFGIAPSHQASCVTFMK